MANLKLDLVNKLNNEKYYDEIELIRLAGDPNMDYKRKMDEMSVKLKNITLINAQLKLVEQYFKEPTSQNPIIDGEKNISPTEHVHQGQSHGE